MTHGIKTDLYSINKNIIGQFPSLSKSKLEKLKDALSKLVKGTDCKYFMLLSNEKKDYTVFNIQSAQRHEAGDKFSKEVFECLCNRGVIKEFDLKKEYNAIEVWIDDSFYVIFPYDLGVIEI